MYAVLHVDSQGVKQLKALLKFTTDVARPRHRLHSFFLFPDAIVATDGFCLGLIRPNSNIRWNALPADTGLTVHAKTFVQMMPNGDPATVQFTNSSYAVEAATFRSRGTVEQGHAIAWTNLIPADTGERHLPGFFNPALMSKFAGLANAIAGKPRQAVRLEASSPAAELKAMKVVNESDDLLGLLMPMRIGKE